MDQRVVIALGPQARQLILSRVGILFTSKYKGGGGQIFFGGQGGCDSAGPRTPTCPPPPPPKGAFCQQLVVKGTGLRSPWAPEVPIGPQAPNHMCLYT